MVTNWSISKDELYGPPPAYSVDPPSSIYTIPERRHRYEERPEPRQSLALSFRFLRYLLGSGLLHILIGLGAIVCDILLISMSESYSFSGLWAGASCIILGIYLILFMSHPEKHIDSFYRFKLIHITTCLIITTALILSSINLISNSCNRLYLDGDQCQQSAQKLKISLVSLFGCTLFQICLTTIMACIHVT